MDRETHIRSIIIPCRCTSAEVRLLDALASASSVSRSAIIRSALIVLAAQEEIDEYIILAACAARDRPQGTGSVAAPAPSRP
jgi:predicted transcriptional regulator